MTPMYVNTGACTGQRTALTCCLLLLPSLRWCLTGLLVCAFGWDVPVSLLPFLPGALGLQHIVSTCKLSVDSRDLKSGPLACTGIPFIPRPSQQPVFYFFVS